jgi:hypothetical protein
MSSTDLRARMRAELAAKAAPTRAEGTRTAIAAYAVAVTAMLAIFQSAGGLSHSAGRPLALTVGVALAVAVLGVVATVLTRPKAGSMLPRRLAVYALLALVAPLAVFAVTVAWNGLYTEPFQRFGWRCMGLALATGSLLAGAVFALRRGRAIHHAGAQGAAIGAMCAIWANVLVDLWCPLTNAPHVLVGHVAPTALLAAAGWLVGRWALPLRPR